LALTIKELEKEKIVSVASKYFEGFTLYEATGFWRGQQEKTAVIEIETDEEEKVKLLTTDLLKELKQEALGVLATGEKMDFITLK
jgi:lipopolysaccharide biosynthesis glycosyltransferase